MDRRYDFLVIGSGIAGLFYALKIAERDAKARIAIVTKKDESDTSTNRAQGGIAAVLADTDSFDAHIADTLRVGGGLCHRDVVEKIVRSGPKVIDQLVDYGVRFTRIDGHYDLGREGGHSYKRVVHAADLTGKEIESALLQACRQHKNIAFFPNHAVLDLITYRQSDQEHCVGAFVFREEDREFNLFLSTVTMLASGGLGMVYFHTSNPKIATGDGVGISYRAGVPVGNLEFIQFHPTILYSPGRRPFLISEAVRGEGGNLAPRDIVARAIDKELKGSGEEYVLLETKHLGADFIKKRFPNIYRKCLRYGFDITKRDIPVVPAAHYSCGGVVADVNGTTALAGLYVAGEVAMTGMHGANRLASNSLLEAVVMADQAARASYDFYKDTVLPDSLPVDRWPYSSLQYPRERILIAHDRRQLTRVMSDFVGIVRNEDRLVLALEKVEQIKKAIEEYYMAAPATYAVAELRNIATVAELIVRSALWRKESRGLHFVEEYPESRKDFERDTIIESRREKETV
jgi:L-aspartate oxidase